MRIALGPDRKIRAFFFSTGLFQHLPTAILAATTHG
jgi:hypothetical protein